MKKDRKRCMSVHNQLSQYIKMLPYDSAAPNPGRADTFYVICVCVGVLLCVVFGSTLERRSPLECSQGDITTEAKHTFKVSVGVYVWAGAYVRVHYSHHECPCHLLCSSIWTSVMDSTCPSGDCFFPALAVLLVLLCPLRRFAFAATNPYSALREGAPESSSASAGRDFSGECLRDVLGRGPGGLLASRLAEVEPCSLHGKRRAAHSVRASSVGFSRSLSRSSYADRSSQCFVIRRLG